VTLDAVRFAFGTLTAVPVRAGRTDRGVAQAAMALAPLVGVVVGALAAGVLLLGRAAGLAPLVAAALAVGAGAVLSRGLHLDGLADLADGLGSGRPAPDALAVMKRSDIGPFGVVTVALVLLLQVSALAQAEAAGHGWSAAVLGLVTGRLAIPLACRRGVPPARPDGLGAHVAASQPLPLVVAAVVAVTAGAAALGALDGMAAWRAGAAVVCGLAFAIVLERHAVRRLGGITGDVLGALVETATTVALVVLATG
jgi:adenosylcobinamide-GDP ribazoletransferase